MTHGGRWSGRTANALSGAIVAGAVFAAPATGQIGEPERASEPPALPEIFRMPDSVAPSETAPAPDSLEGLVLALDAEAFGEREAATESLRERAGELHRAVERGRIRPQSLSPEQRKRVADVLEAHFYETPRAGLGVQFAPMNPAGNGVSLQMVLGEFPASRVLVAGDAIVLVDGMDIADMPTTRAMELLRAMIIARNPGETLPMTVQRGGVQHELDVELGDFRNLGNASVPQELDLLRAWELRAESLGLRERWDGRVETTVSRRDWPTQRRPFRIDPAASIFAAGTSQSANLQLLSIGLPLRQREAVDAMQDQQGRILQQRERTIDERRDQLVAQIEQLALRAQLTEQRANDLNAGEAQRREAAILLVQIRARISELRDELERLERR